MPEALWPMDPTFPICFGASPPTSTRFSRVRSPATCRSSSPRSSSSSSTSRPPRPSASPSRHRCCSGRIKSSNDELGDRVREEGHRTAMRRKGGGSYYRRGEVYWVKYYKDGRPYRESTGSSLERDAKNLLDRRLGDIAAGRPLSPRADRIKIGELLDDLLVEYQVNERASLRRMKELVNHVRPALGTLPGGSGDHAGR